MKRLLVAGLFLLAGCDALRDAMSTRTNVAAEAAEAELTVAQLAELLGKSQAPLQRDIANALVDAWIDYHLVAEAAVQNDSLKDTTQMDSAMWSAIANIKAGKYFQRVSPQFAAAANTISPESLYNRGEILAASHILFMTQNMPDSAKAAARLRADQVRSQATAQNFADLARRNSQDPGSAQRGGSLGLFPPGAMVGEFEQALRALKPGEISPVVETMYGYHILRRPTYAEIQGEAAQAGRQRAMQVAEMDFLTRLEREAGVKMRDGIAPVVRSVIEDPNARREDRTVLASSKLGDFTAGDLARWVGTLDPMSLGRVQQGAKTSPDSLMPQFVMNFVRNELVLDQANKANIKPDAKELSDLRNMFRTAVTGAWTGLGIDPKQLAATKSEDERRRTAMQRVNDYIRRLMAQQARYVDISGPVREVLREKYDYKINREAVGRALIEAANVRLRADSSAAPKQPPSVVPMPNTDTARK